MLFVDEQDGTHAIAIVRRECRLRIQTQLGKSVTPFKNGNGKIVPVYLASPDVYVIE